MVWHSRIVQLQQNGKQQYQNQVVVYFIFVVVECFELTRFYCSGFCSEINKNKKNVLFQIVLFFYFSVPVCGCGCGCGCGHVLLIFQQGGCDWWMSKTTL
jgi:hypothetical protein